MAAPQLQSFSLALPATDDNYVSQVRYAMHFCDPAIASFAIDASQLTVTLMAGADKAAVTTKATKLLERYAAHRESFHAQSLWQTGKGLNPQKAPNVWDELATAKLVYREGTGRVALRGLAADLLEGIDRWVETHIAREMGCTREVYPGTIGCDDLARPAYFSNFPHHIQFVVHMREDLDAIDAFTAAAKIKPEWTPDVAASALGNSGVPAAALNPSVCYHTYAGMSGTDAAEGRSITARTRCHRYEGGNLTGLARLADFDMREVVFVGKPDFVLKSRDRAQELLRGMAETFALDSDFVSANDPFFTSDYEVKASFQHRQSMKHELCVALPGGKHLAIASSNFHSTAMGKAFNIIAGTRPACTGCLGWGLERWVLAVFMQHGLDSETWPATLKKVL